jgi:superoxide dismutase, Fe-Mn family
MLLLEVAVADTYTLPALPYDYDALEPHISAKVMHLHHDKHHAAYVKGANEALEKIADARNATDFSHIGQLEKNLAFNLSGHVLHSLFWLCLSPQGGGAPGGRLADRIAKDFGSLDQLVAQLTAVTTSLQGSGWGALAWEPVAGRLVVQQIYDHQTNVGQGSSPLLVIDGWEHAYYLDHLNDKASWLAAFWKLADWSGAERRFDQLSPRTSAAA